MSPPTTNAEDQFARTLIRNCVIGLIATFAVAFGLCVLSQSATIAAEVAVLPAVFAAPFVGGAITVVGYTRVRIPSSRTASPVEAKSRL